MKSFGTAIWVLSGGAMFLFWLAALTRWWGGAGLILGLVVAPGAVIFPFVYWFKEGSFPMLYFAIWGVGLVGLFLSAVSKSE